MQFTQDELKSILQKHDDWLANREGGKRANLRGADLCGANLCGANLYDANLRGANLYGANLRGANLRGANLYGANLCGANLRGANLYDADLRGANLYGANLCGADLRDADLRGADLRGANLRGANLYDADLRGANLYGANLCGADLRDADLRGAKNVPFIPYACPDVGSFIGYKKAGDYIVELEILSDARRCSATGRKCRCDKAKVLSIQTKNGKIAEIKSIRSDHNKDFIYKVGEIVEEPNFNEDRWNECSEGIHFFINRQEAVDY